MRRAISRGPFSDDAYGMLRVPTDSQQLQCVAAVYLGRRPHDNSPKVLYSVYMYFT